MLTPRSALFVPADRPERHQKAFDSGAIAVIVDLEDAVAANRKDASRQTLVETAAGILDATRVAAHPAVDVLMSGPVDLSLELGIEERPDGDGLGTARGLLVLAAAAAGIPGPLDGPCVLPRDAAAPASEIDRARRLGFAGKSCIHPAQVEPVNAAFAPTAAEIAWAGGVIAAYDEAGDSGVVMLDGEMIDLPVVLRARRILERA